MENDRQWVITRIGGKIASISSDYRQFSQIATRIAKMPVSGIPEITCTKIPFHEVWRLRQETTWDDFILFGTEFQKKVWKKLFELTHGTSESGETGSVAPKLICYSDFAELLDNRAGVRAVSHALGLNPVAVIIPCHLVIPKESIDRINEIKKRAEATIFKGDDLCMDSILRDKVIDFGEYALGRKLKRELIIKEFE